MRFLRAAGSKAAIPKGAIAMPSPPVRAPGLARRPPAESNHPDPRAQKTRGGRNRSGETHYLFLRHVARRFSVVTPQAHSRIP